MRFSWSSFYEHNQSFEILTLDTHLHMIFQGREVGGSPQIWDSQLSEEPTKEVLV